MLFRVHFEMKRLVIEINDSIKFSLKYIPLSHLLSEYVVHYAEISDSGLLSTFPLCQNNILQSWPKIQNLCQFAFFNLLCTKVIVSKDQ